MLWFIRDRSAIVQTLLVPLSVAGLQVFNLRGVLIKAEGAWNYLCGVAIFFGTYFLGVLGPKSLQSEGSAPLDRAHLAARLGKPLESQGMAVVYDLVGAGCDCPLLRRIQLPRRHLENRPGRRRLVLLCPQHG